MLSYSKEELEEALKAIVSTISKCENALPKLKQNSAIFMNNFNIPP